jgi:hypothetical protein
MVLVSIVMIPIVPFVSGLVLLESRRMRRIHVLQKIAFRKRKRPERGPGRINGNQ